MTTPKAFSFRGASPPDPLTRGSAPGPRWGHSPQTPIIGSRSPYGPLQTVLLDPPLYVVVEDDRSCTVSVTSEPAHITAQTSTRCGTSRRPWQLDAPAGQRIALGVLDFNAPSTTGDDRRPADGRCRGRVYGFLVDKTRKTNVSVCDTTSARATTQDDDRRTAASNSAELIIVRDDQRASDFMITVEGQ